MKPPLCKTSRTVLFDLDGTLLDTLTDLTDAVNAVLSVMGLPARRKDQVRQALGNGAAHLLRASLPGHEDRLEEALALFKKVYPPATDPKTAPYPGIPALLARLSAENWQMAVISNKPDPAVKILRDTFFPSIRLAVGERQGVRRKPFPDGVFSAMADLHADPARCVYVGDSEVDLLTAQNALLPCVLVTWGFRDRAFLEKQGGALFAGDPEELYQRLTALFDENAALRQNETK